MFINWVAANNQGQGQGAGVAPLLKSDPIGGVHREFFQ